MDYVRKCGLLCVGLLVAGNIVSTAHGAPTRSAPATSLAGNGLNYHTHTVGTGSADFKPDTIAEALDLLAASPTGFTVGQSFDLTAPYINHGDDDYVGAVAPAQRILDAGSGSGSDTFASEFFGYINITSGGTYAFRSFHDDGFRLTLGGEVVSDFDGNTSPAETIVELDLESGLYALHYVGWEQGGLFIQELSWKDDSTDTAFSLVPTSVLFRSLPTQTVPLPGTLALLFAACLATLACRGSRE